MADFTQQVVKVAIISQAYVHPVGTVLPPQQQDATVADFVIVAFDPLRGSLISNTETTLTLTIQQISGTLDTTAIELKLDRVLIYGVGADPTDPTFANWAPDFSTSTIVPLGGGVFRFNIVKTSLWISGTRHELILFLPFET